MRIMRHSQIAITMDVYTHVPSEETRDALKRLGASLGAMRTAAPVAATVGG
jgi:integrase